MDVNNNTIVGRLATQPSLSTHTRKSDASEGYRCYFRVAVTRLSDLGRARDARRTNYIPCVAWGAPAQHIAEHLNKGDEVSITGEIIAESETIDIESKTYRDDFHIQIARIQFGRRSQKNATRKELVTEAKALQNRMNAMAAGAGQKSVAAGKPAIVSGKNPFEQRA